MINAAITGVGAWLPPTILDNKELEKRMDVTDEWIVSRMGIRQRRVLEIGRAHV